MTSDQLAAAVEETVKAAKSRVTGIGKEQYDQGDTQQFESMTTRELLQWAHEEALDLVVYGVMAAIRIKRVERALKKGFDL